MKILKGALGFGVAVVAAAWGIVWAALTSGRRRTTASVGQVNTIRRSYALGAASRERFEAAVKKLRPSARHSARPGSKSSRKTAA